MGPTQVKRYSGVERTTEESGIAADRSAKARPLFSGCCSDQVAGSGQERGIDPASGRLLCIIFARSIVRVVPLIPVLLDVLLDVSPCISFYFLLYFGAGFVCLGFIVLRLFIFRLIVVWFIVVSSLGSTLLRAFGGFSSARLFCVRFRFLLVFRRLWRLLLGSLLSGLDCGRKQIIGSHPHATPSDAAGIFRLLQMGDKFFVSGDPFILQELQNSRALSLQGLHRGEQVVKYLLHKINIIILVHIDSSRNLPLDAERRAIGEGVCVARAPLRQSSGQALTREKPISERLAT